LRPARELQQPVLLCAEPVRQLAQQQAKQQINRNKAIKSSIKIPIKVAVIELAQSSRNAIAIRSVIFTILEKSNGSSASRAGKTTI